MSWCSQAASHYLSQCRRWYMSPYGVIRPQWVKQIVEPGSISLIIFPSQFRSNGIFVLLYANSSKVIAMKFCTWHRPLPDHPLLTHMVSPGHNELIYHELLRQTVSQQNTVECHYSAVQYNMICHTPLHWLMQNINPTLDSQKTPYLAPTGELWSVFCEEFW